MKTIESLKKAFGFIEHRYKKNLLESHMTRLAHIEFTSRCNLRCVFCNASQPLYNGTDLDGETIEKTIEVLKKRKVNLVCVSGHGETTIYNNWHRYCNKMLEAGIHLHIISNFAKDFSEEEIKILSRFKSIEISCDTSNPLLFKQLRRGADLKTLCLNILKLKAAADKEGRQPPSLSFSCVVSDQNIFKLMDYVSFGKSLGVTHFNFCNLTKYPDLKDTLNPRHIASLPAELLPKAEASLTGTFDFLRCSNIGYHVQQGLLDTLQQKIHILNTPAPDKDHHVNKNHQVQKKEINEEESIKQVDDNARPHRYSSSKQGSQTRDCSDPWEFIMIQANKDVLPCCWHKPIYSLSKGQSLLEVFNGTQIKELRRRLLTGNLSADCMNCPSRSWTSIHNLQKKVWRYLNPGIYKLWFSKIPTIKTEILRNFEMSYEHGWYDPETNLTIEDPDWQHWRWTAKKASCKVENPKRKALLILRGSVDKSIFWDQGVRIKLNGTLLDEFTPGTAKFYKEYVITAEMMGENEPITLAIETNKTFIPSKVVPGIVDSRELGIQVYQLFFGERI
jgi:MoaA/NifB/PqqE/SkfB family radical SAM enzyme